MVRYQQNGITYIMKAFISLEADTLAVEFSADRPGSLSMSGLLTRGRYYNCAGSAERTRSISTGIWEKAGASSAYRRRPAYRAEVFRRSGSIW